MTCSRCGSPAEGRFCQHCARDVRRGADATDDAPAPSTDTKPYRCTACGHEWETTDPGACPACGARRRRYIGPLGGRV